VAIITVSGAHPAGANLFCANLTAANLTHADLSGATLDGQAQLDLACGTPAHLPEGFIHRSRAHDGVPIPAAGARSDQVGK
jgi:Pentapeptide repeats (8 copies)